jgi:Pup-ligase protein
MDAQVFGLRNEYSVVFSARGQRHVSPEEVGNGLSSALTRARPLLNTRDEPHAAAAGLRRLRVSVSDSTMSETTTLLKAGATHLVLRMAEAATVIPDFPTWTTRSGRSAR